MNKRRRHFKAIDADRERWQPYPLDHLLEDCFSLDDASPGLRQAVAEKRLGIQHPQLGNLRYEYFYHWIGLQTVEDYELRIDISGTSDGLDPMFTDEVAFALSNFDVVWADALSFINENKHQFDIADPNGFSPTGIIGLQRKDQKIGFELTMFYKKDRTRYWWIEFQNKKAVKLNFSLSPITVSRVE